MSNTDKNDNRAKIAGHILIKSALSERHFNYLHFDTSISTTIFFT